MIAGEGYRIELGDALRLLGELEDGSVDALVTDPPYSSGGMFRGDRAQDTNTKYVGTDVAIRDKREVFEGDNRDQRSYLMWCNLWLGEARRKVKPGGIAAVFSDWRQLPTMTDALQVGGWVWRGILGWDKTEGVRPQLGRFRQQLEFVPWASNGPMPFGGRVAGGCWRIARDEDAREHATGKPVELMQKILELLPPGALVLDPFMGTGSTGVAALRRGLRFVGFELAPSIFERAAARLAAEVGPVARDGVQLQLGGMLATTEGGRSVGLYCPPLPPGTPPSSEPYKPDAAEVAVFDCTLATPGAEAEPGALASAWEAALAAPETPLPGGLTVNPDAPAAIPIDPSALFLDVPAVPVATTAAPLDRDTFAEACKAFDAAVLGGPLEPDEGGDHGGG